LLEEVHANHADEDDPTHAHTLPPSLSLTCGSLMACLISSRCRSASDRGL
jgi:hypothetical protein